MGCHVHVISKQAQYGHTAAFNWGIEDFKMLLCSCGATINEMGEDEFELNLNVYKAIITILKRLSKNSNLSTLDLVDLRIETEYGILFDPESINLEEVKKDIKKLKHPIDELISILKDFYKERDKKSCWIQFSAF